MCFFAIDEKFCIDKKLIWRHKVIVLNTNGAYKVQSFIWWLNNDPVYTLHPHSTEEPKISALPDIC